MGEWQPIETAPRDGTRFLGFGRPGSKPKKLYVCKFEYGGFFSEPGNFSRKPTHWMPLPEPPND